MLTAQLRTTGGESEHPPATKTYMRKSNLRLPKSKGLPEISCTGPRDEPEPKRCRKTRTQPFSIYRNNIKKSDQTSAVNQATDVLLDHSFGSLC